MLRTTGSICKKRKCVNHWEYRQTESIFFLSSASFNMFWGQILGSDCMPCFKRGCESLPKRQGKLQQTSSTHLHFNGYSSLPLGDLSWDKNSYGTSITTVCSLLIKLQCSCSWFQTKHHTLSKANLRQSSDQAWRRNFTKTQRQGAL